MTPWGKVMDPVADKLLVISALVLLVNFHRVDAWIAVVLIGREMAVTGLRAVVMREGIIIPADRWGKYKMASQITAIAMLLWYLETPVNFRVLGTIFIWISMVLAVYSGIHYFVNYARKSYK